MEAYPVRLNIVTKNSFVQKYLQHAFSLLEGQKRKTTFELPEILSFNKACGEVLTVISDGETLIKLYDTKLKHLLPEKEININSYKIANFYYVNFVRENDEKIKYKWLNYALYFALQDTNKDFIHNIIYSLLFDDLDINLYASGNDYQKNVTGLLIDYLPNIYILEYEQRPNRIEMTAVLKKLLDEVKSLVRNCNYIQNKHDFSFFERKFNSLIVERQFLEEALVSSGGYLKLPLLYPPIENILIFSSEEKLMQNLFYKEQSQKWEKEYNEKRPNKEEHGYGAKALILRD